MYEPQNVTAWRRSSRCGDNACVEIATTQTGVAIRDSKQPQGAPLYLSRSEFSSFVAGIRAGDFDVEAS